MGIVAHRSWGLGNTFPSWSFRSAQPWPSGNQIQSAHSCSLSQDNILTDKTDNDSLYDCFLYSHGRSGINMTLFVCLYASARFFFWSISQFYSAVTKSWQEREERERPERSEYWSEVINLTAPQQQAPHLGTSCSGRREIMKGGYYYAT